MSCFFGPLTLFGAFLVSNFRPKLVVMLPVLFQLNCFRICVYFDLIKRIFLNCSLVQASLNFAIICARSKGFSKSDFRQNLRQTSAIFGDPISPNFTSKSTRFSMSLLKALA
ncbi:hypothetical protein L596_024640 [Steinernema carpocapsae]|uniref:Uncharacterized protein n=1 Tax=Steinernema carpocapsae TaxID=34508 RepID=A0A4U5M5D4_STECR|nr:hypothetical protein L596_024640 [Steinernema carpocapsae]